MTKDIFWTAGGIALLSLAGLVVLSAPEQTVEGTTSDAGERPAAATAVTRPATADRSTATRPVHTPRQPQPPVHWSAAPYATDEDVYALVFQPRGAAATADFAALEALLGEALPREIAERTEWVAAYGRSVGSELDIARNLTTVIRQAEPTTALELATERYSDRKLTEAVLGETPYVRVAETTETVLIERADKSGDYSTKPHTIEHEPLAIVEHDPQTFLIVGEARLATVLAASSADTALARGLGGLSPEAHCAFFCRNAGGSILETLVRTGGDRSAALAKPLLEMLHGAADVRVTAGLGGDHLARATLTFGSGDESAKTMRLLVGLRDRSRALLEDAASGGSPSAEVVAARRLLERLQFEAQEANVVVTLPRPADLRELFGQGQVSSR